MADDLVKRLREVGGISDDGATRWYINPDGPEAADRIEKLERENNDTALHLYAFASRIEKLDAALRVIVQVWDTDQPISIARAALARDAARKALEGKDD